MKSEPDALLSGSWLIRKKPVTFEQQAFLLNRVTGTGFDRGRPGYDLRPGVIKSEPDDLVFLYQHEKGSKFYQLRAFFVKPIILITDLKIW
jgi:hypothetical protein